MLMSCQILGESFLQKLHTENGQKKLVAFMPTEDQPEPLVWGCLFLFQRTQNIDIVYQCLIPELEVSAISRLTPRLHKSTINFD